MAQPGEALRFLLRRTHAALVFPVGGDALFRHLVHFVRADLHFKGLAVGTDHRGVKRLVKIGARDGDEILDASRHRSPGVVNDAQRRIAILHGVGDDADGEQVEDLID